MPSDDSTSTVTRSAAGMGILIRKLRHGGHEGELAKVGNYMRVQLTSTQDHIFMDVDGLTDAEIDAAFAKLAEDYVREVRFKKGDPIHIAFMGDEFGPYVLNDYFSYATRQNGGFVGHTVSHGTLPREVPISRIRAGHYDPTSTVNDQASA